MQGPAALGALDLKRQPTPFALDKKHIRLLNEKIRDLCLGRSEKRGLMVFMPPRHGKTFTGSIYTPSWYVSLYPSRSVLLASYEADFARGWGRKARDVTERWGPELFGISVRGDSHAADRWEIAKHGGGMQTGGIGGPFSGKPAHLGIIDDPVKNAEEAMSATVQEKHWDWYVSVWQTRREPGWSSLYIATRWNENDLAGKILRSEGEDWDVLRLPALAEENDPIGREVGEALWPERYSREYLEKLRDRNAYWFRCMYQGDPRPREGGMFGEWTIVDLDSVPQPEMIARYWDLASTAKRRGSDPDWTVGAKACTADGMFWVLDVERFRAEPYDKERRIIEVAREDGPLVPVVLEQEPGSSGKDLINHYARKLPQHRVYGVRSTGNKETRADITSSKAFNGTLRLVRGDWNDAWIEEHRGFPDAVHDDQVDAGSGVVSWLAEMTDPGDEVYEEFEEVEISPY
jgi:predicted phage terminase large subunit-like protein